MPRIWFITGSSRGLGRSLTEAVLAKGDRIAATARNPEQLQDLARQYPDRLYPVQLEVTDPRQINVGNPGLTIYQAAKFGLGGFSEGLAREVAPLGIRVTCVEPGGFRTDWGGASMSFAPVIEGYETTVGWITEFIRKGDYQPMGDPAKAATVMVELVGNAEPPVHLILGSEAIALVRQADGARQSELEKWLPVSTSTDHDDAVNFLETEAGRKLARR